jgi:hypothetical protein
VWIRFAVLHCRWHCFAPLTSQAIRLPATLQVLQVVGALPPQQLTAAAPGLPALLAATTEACALSSQPDKLPQLLVRACSCLPPGAGAACFQALLGRGDSSVPAAAAWLRPEQVVAALDLLLQFARHKGVARCWAQILTKWMAEGSVHPIAGLWATCLALHNPADGAGNSAEAAAAAVAADCIQQLLQASSDGSTCTGGQCDSSEGCNRAAAKGRARGKAATAAAADKGAADGGSSGAAGGGVVASAREWLLQVAAAGVEQLQQAATKAASEPAAGAV